MEHLHDLIAFDGRLEIAYSIPFLQFDHLLSHELVVLMIPLHFLLIAGSDI